MRKVLRREGNDAYWDRRWAETGRDPDDFTDLGIYPIRYAELVMREPGRALEIGCGLGRVLKHYHRRGWHIDGVERSEVAVARLREEDASYRVQVADVRSLPFPDGYFDVVLAFGVYHNLEDGLTDALHETARCLRPGGRFCISMRPDNVEMRLNEWYWRLKHRDRQGPRTFHKWLVGEREFSGMLRDVGLRVEHVHRARNVSLLYRVPWLRASARDETERRGGGYRLNLAGRLLDRALMRWFAKQSCNVAVFIGVRP